MAPVYITGVGAVTPLGVDNESFKAGLFSGESAIRERSRLECNYASSTLAGEVPEFSLEDYLESKKTYLDRCSELALAASALAVRQAGWELSKEVRSRYGVVLGTAFGCLESMDAFLRRVYQKGARFANPLMFSHSYVNTPTSLVAIEFGLKGYHSTMSTGLTSGADSLEQGLLALERGHADGVLCVGVDALSPMVYESLDNNGLLSPGDSETEEGAFPFGAAHNGAVAAEGAAGLTLSADSEGAIAVLAGYGYAAESDDELKGDALKQAIKEAVRDARTKMPSIDAVFASANGQPELDDYERDNLKGVLKKSDVPVTAIKSLTGETWGAGPIINVAAAVAALERQCVPAIANWTEPAKAGLKYAAEPVERPLRNILVISTDPGGACAAMIVQAV